MAEHAPCLACSSPPQRVGNWRKWSVGEMAVHPLRVLKYPGENKQALESQASSTEGWGKHRWEKWGKGHWKVLRLWNQWRETETSWGLGSWETCLEIPRVSQRAFTDRKESLIIRDSPPHDTLQAHHPSSLKLWEFFLLPQRSCLCGSDARPTSSTRSRKRQELLFFLSL